MFKKLRSTRRHFAIFAVLAVSAVTGATAVASDVNVAVVDVTVPASSVTLTAGTSAPITINMSVSGNQDGIATFEVYRNWTLSGGTWTGSNPQEFTVAARNGGDPATTFTTSGTVSVNSTQAAGTFTLAVGAFDITNSNATGGKLAAGASSSYSVTVNAAPSDSSPPEIEANVAGTLGLNGWHTSDVTLSWNVSDAQSAVSSTSGCATTYITADQGATTYTCTATSAGGTNSKTVSIKRDATLPTVAFNGGPADGGTYFPLTVPAAPTCVGSDTTSLLASCVISGYSTAVGPQTMTATAEDNAGNTAIATRSYTVRPPFTLAGFFQPVDMSGVVNTVKNGATVPLKFTVVDEGVAQTSTEVVKSFTAREVNCTAMNTNVTDDIEITTTGQSALRYDAVAGQFVQNYQTAKKVGTCWIATVTFISNQTISANFKLK